MGSGVEIIDSGKHFSQGNVNGLTEQFIFHDDAIYWRYLNIYSVSWQKAHYGH